MTGASGTAPAPRAAASVILARETSDGIEIYLLRRHRKASFMSSSFVFPGGIVDEGEDDPRETAIRELFEEAGVLLCKSEVDASTRGAWREKLNRGEARFRDLIDPAELDLDALHYYAHWVTPTVEKRRYSAQFFVARMPAKQVASPDNRETVDEVWVAPSAALDRRAELRLPPPQHRSFHELVAANVDSIDALVALANTRAQHKHAILPRGLSGVNEFTLLLPWDRDYEEHGLGEGLTIASDHPLAVGPSRFILRATGWDHE